MALFQLNADRLDQIDTTSLVQEGIREADDLQRILRKQIEVVSPGTLIISEEFCQWDDSLRRIDLLGLDQEANLVVIELKRTQDGGHMELQALRYAAMVSTMTFERAVEVYGELIRSNGTEEDPKERILGFLGWDNPNEEEFAREVRIVLVSQGFQKEITTTVMWLNDRGLDIQCVRLGAYRHEGKILLDVQQVIPLPETADYQIKIREKHRQAQTEAGPSLNWRALNRKKLYSTVTENPRRPDTHGSIALQAIMENPGILYDDWVQLYRATRPQDKGHPYRHLQWDYSRGRVRIED